MFHGGLHSLIRTIAAVAVAGALSACSVSYDETKYAGQSGRPYIPPTINKSVRLSLAKPRYAKFSTNDWRITNASLRGTRSVYKLTESQIAAVQNRQEMLQEFYRAKSSEETRSVIAAVRASMSHPGDAPTVDHTKQAAEDVSSSEVSIASLNEEMVAEHPQFARSTIPELSDIAVANAAVESTEQQAASVLEKIELSSLEQAEQSDLENRFQQLMFEAEVQQVGAEDTRFDSLGFKKKGAELAKTHGNTSIFAGLRKLLVYIDPQSFVTSPQQFLYALCIIFTVILIVLGGLIYHMFFSQSQPTGFNRPRKY